MSRITQSATVVVAVLFLLVSSVAPFAGAGAASPSGMVGVPSEQVTDKIPQHAQEKIPSAAAFEGGVQASKHADALEVEITTRAAARGHAQACSGRQTPDWCASPQLAINLSDDVNHEGRTVALPAAPVADAVGTMPKTATVTNDETGESYRVPVEREGDVLLLEVEHFSTNTVTFAGEVAISANPAADASSYTYDVTDTDAVDNYTIDVTGSTAREWDNETASGAGLSSSQSISPAGNLAPKHSDGGDPALEVTANAPTESHSIYADEAGSTTTDGTNVLYGNDGDTNAPGAQSEVEVVPSYTGPVDEITVTIGASQTSSGPDVDIYLVNEGVDGTYGEGTKIKSNWSPSYSTGSETVTLDNPPEVTSGSTYTIEFVSLSSDGTTDAAYVDYQTASSTKYSDNGILRDHYADVDISVDRQVNSLSASDDQGNSVSIGSMNDTETVTKRLNIQTSSTELNWSGSGGGSVDYALRMQEGTQTVDPQVTVNGGNTTGYTGSLSDGTTASLTTDPAWVNAGTNTVDVAVGDGTLSSDAPTPQVGLAYSHQAQDEVSVDYVAEQWSERYNVSHTYADETAGAATTIPFDSNRVVAVRSVEQRINGGNWETVSSSTYSFDGTELTVEHGDLAADSTVEVRAAGEKVKTYNGEIRVKDPSAPGEALDTKFEIHTWNADSYIGVSGTKSGDRLHYTYNESWSEPDEHAEIQAGGTQRLHIPNGASGGTARVTTLPLGVTPASNEVLVGVDRAGSTPLLDVAPGARSGDEVTFEWRRTTTDVEYILHSETNGVQRDSDVAESPAYLSDDDGDEILKIFAADSDGSSTGDGDGDGDIDIAGGAGNGGITVGSSLFVVLALGLLTGMWYVSNRWGSGSISTRTYVALGAVTLIVLGLEVLSPASIVTGIVRFLAGASTAWPLIVIAVAILGYYYLRQRGKPQKVVNFRLGRGGE